MFECQGDEGDTCAGLGQGIHPGWGDPRSVVAASIPLDSHRSPPYLLLEHPRLPVVECMDCEDEGNIGKRVARQHSTSARRQEDPGKGSLGSLLRLFFCSSSLA